MDPHSESYGPCYARKMKGEKSPLPGQYNSSVSIYHICYIYRWQLVHIWAWSASRGAICSQSAYISPYTRSIICITINDYIIFIISFLKNTGMFFKWKLVSFTSHSNLPKFTVWSPVLNNTTTKRLLWLVQLLIYQLVTIYTRLLNGCNIYPKSKSFDIRIHYAGIWNGWVQDRDRKMGVYNR